VEIAAIPHSCPFAITVMSEEWFSHKLAPDGETEDSCHPEEAQALKDYLQQETTVKVAARAITRPIESASNPGEDLHRLYALLIDALIELPSSETPSLIGLIQAIEDLPEPDMSAIKKSKLPAHGVLWRGLPGFGHLYADLHQSSSWRNVFDTEDPLERDDLRKYHVKKAGIEACLAKAELAGIPMYWGYECVSDALECSNALLDFEVPAAAEWLFVAGDRLRVGALKEEESWALEKERDLWKAGKAMTVERWSFWESRLLKLQSGPGVVSNAASMAYVECVVCRLRSVGMDVTSRHS
jgi:hypothetical protein